MKVVLSRKGFDSQYGGMPSPVLPDGTLLSLPIPSKADTDRFTDLHWHGKSYYDLIHELKPDSKIKESYTCHLDPDIRAGAKARPQGWTPAFGQEKAALSHLRNQQVGVGDLFLFFGWFRMTELSNGKLAYVKGAPDWHVIYGYLQVGAVIDTPADVPAWLTAHPHAREERWQHPNAIYVASSALTFMPGLPGATCLPFADRRVLTKPGCQKRVWALPEFFRQIPITYNANAWTDEGFVSAAKGQEFVFEANAEAMEWIKDVLKKKTDL